MSSPSPADAATPRGVPHPALVVRTIAVPTARVADLLSLLPEPEDAGDVVSWVRKGEGFVGWGRVATFTASGPERFEQAQEWWRQVTAEAIVRDDVDEPGTGPIAFGSMAYSRRSGTESVLVVPEVVVGRRGDRRHRRPLCGRLDAGEIQTPTLCNEHAESHEPNLRGRGPRRNLYL